MAADRGAAADEPAGAGLRQRVVSSGDIDALLAQELEQHGAELSPVTRDEDFLRRAFIDLTGKPPAPDRLDQFVRDPDPAKRSKLIAKLLETDDYAHNWARYWRDVILYHALDRRVALGAKPFENWMADQLKKNVPWDKVATQLLTATGRMDEDPSTFLIAAQFDQQNMPVNLAAETTRIFLGIQVQCAQCHDHPYDQWKREQFHQMAAFFARTRARLDRSKDQPTLVVFSVRGGGPFARGGGPLEYFMPDKEDPEKKILTQPKFLLGQSIEPNQSDLDRRNALAALITDESDPWFARAYVNRIWGALMGEGFYEPIDDLGPGRTPRFPVVINRIASAWRASDYDVKWLFRLVMNTEAYQREIRPRDASEQRTPFASVCPTRLSADQIFDSLATALGIDESSAFGPGPGMRPGGMGYPGARFGIRGLFNLQFGVDPSAPSEETQGTIPQALLLMNSPLVERQLSSGGNTLLGRLLPVYDDDAEVIGLLYKRVLARAPSDNELATCRAYIAEVGDRREAFEDVLWSLVNSTEFITKR